MNKTNRQFTGSVHPDANEYQQAEQFLKVLLRSDSAADLPVTWQVFQEPEKGAADHFTATLSHAWSKLAAANQSGCGIFLMINEGDGKGRRAKNVRAVRAVFIDLDGGNIEGVRSSSLPPSLVVESSPGRFHCYWVVDDCPLDEFGRIQKSLAECFSGDPAVSDLCRVMRVPGFLHRKSTPVLTLLKQHNDRSYRLRDIKSFVNKAGMRSKTGTSTAVSVSDKAKTSAARKLEEIHNALGFISPDAYVDYLKIGMAIHSEFPGEDGLKIWDEWCRMSAKYKEGETAQKWETFGRYSGKSVTLASVFKKVKEAGYTPPDQRRKSCNYMEYVEFVLSLPEIKDMKVDILCGELKVLRPTGEWVPVENMLDYIWSYAVENQRLALSHFTKHLTRYAYEDLTPELLINIPEWDKHDRLKDICNVMSVKDFDSNELYELLRFWMVGIFRRVKDPTIQPTTIILRGEQGVGKDTLVTALTGGLGWYKKQLNIDRRDAEDHLHTAVVFVLSEFDRTKWNVANLKHILTTSKTNVRLSYDRRPQDRLVRASFIATCNVEDILRDTTGNRRFWILEMTYGGFARRSLTTFSSIPERDYPGMFSRPEYMIERTQILAQARELSQQGDFRPSAPTLEKMDSLIARMTPRDPFDEAEEQWNEMVCGRCWDIKTYIDGWVSNGEIRRQNIFTAISLSTGLSEQRIRNMLKLRGYEHRTGGQRGYRFKKLPKEVPLDTYDAYPVLDIFAQRVKHNARKTWGNGQDGGDTTDTTDTTKPQGDHIVAPRLSRRRPASRRSKR